MSGEMGPPPQPRTTTYLSATNEVLRPNIDYTINIGSRYDYRCSYSDGRRKHLTVMGRHLLYECEERQRAKSRSSSSSNSATKVRRKQWSRGKLRAQAHIRVTIPRSTYGTMMQMAGGVVTKTTVSAEVSRTPKTSLNARPRRGQGEASRASLMDERRHRSSKVMTTRTCRVNLNSMQSCASRLQAHSSSPKHQSRMAETWRTSTTWSPSSTRCMERVRWTRACCLLPAACCHLPPAC